MTDEERINVLIQLMGIKAGDLGRAASILSSINIEFARELLQRAQALPDLNDIGKYGVKAFSRLIDLAEQWQQEFKETPNEKFGYDPSNPPQNIATNPEWNID